MRFVTPSMLDIAINVPNTDPSLLNVSSELTISTWVKADAVGPTAKRQYIINRQDPFIWDLRATTAGLIEFRLVLDTGYIYCTSNTGIYDGEWHYIAGVYDGSEISIYLDGMLDASMEASGVFKLDDEDPSQARIGVGNRGTTSAGASGWNGLLDDMRVYSSGLTHEVIAQEYANGSGESICAIHLKSDLTGPEDVPDCIVNLYDFAVVAADWLEDSNWPWNL